MNTYSILYRKTNGTTETAMITASTEAEARSAFFMRYDGRIISIS
jgi:hypothetical protein